MRDHLLVLPILLPLTAGALLLLLERLGLGVQRALGMAAAALLLILAVMIAIVADDGAVRVYLVGDWPARLGIALAADRLAAILLCTTAALGLCALIYGCGGWDRRAPHFHALFQFQLAGLNGAFLTADLFNLFVFFEVMLIASYGLLLSGGRGAQMRAGFHYVTFNIVASTLFLIAVALIYGLLGALNMAELAVRAASLTPENAGLLLLHAAAGLLLVVFCAKAALVPLYFWLPHTYAHSPAPAAILFVMLTKVGVYAVLRVYTLIFGGTNNPYVWDLLLVAGAVSLLLASLGALAATRLRQLAAWLVIGSAATLFIAFGLQRSETVGAGFYYLAQSACATAALFFLADQVRRFRTTAGDDLTCPDRLASKTLPGIAFTVIAIALIGLPPLPGFIAKLSLLSAMNDSEAAWLWPLILLTSLFALIALMRAGSQLFWREADVAMPVQSDARLRAIEIAPLLGLIALIFALTLFAAPALRYAEAAARQVLSPQSYIDAVRSAQPSPAREAAP